MIAADYAGPPVVHGRDAEDADVVDSDLPGKLRSPPDHGLGDLRSGRGILGLALHRDDGRMDLIPQHGRRLQVTGAVVSAVSGGEGGLEVPTARIRERRIELSRHAGSDLECAQAWVHVKRLFEVSRDAVTGS